jgi:hypothetical protein
MKTDEDDIDYDGEEDYSYEDDRYSGLEDYYGDSMDSEALIDLSDN